jgi:serine/threonine-protein kinase
VPLAKAAAERAVELDSTLAEVQYALAAVRTWHEWDWAGARSAFERAMELNPNYPDGLAFYSHFLLSMKHPDEAMRQMELAVELDPFNPLIQGFHGFLLFYVGRYDEAIAQFERLLRTVPNDPLAHFGLQQVYHEMGMYEKSLAETNAAYSVMEFTEAEEALATGYAEGGYSAAMSRAADAWAALTRATYVPPYEIASLYALAGEDSKALDWLERSFEERDPNMPYLSVAPLYHRVHDDPRFHDLLRRMNLPP